MLVLREGVCCNVYHDFVLTLQPCELFGKMGSWILRRLLGRLRTLAQQERAL